MIGLSASLTRKNVRKTKINRGFLTLWRKLAPSEPLEKGGW